MKITVLAAAAATDMTLVFCNCCVCRRSRWIGNWKIRKRASIVMNDEMMFDSGSGSILACSMCGIDVGNVSYLVQTHPHSDHLEAGYFVARWSGKQCKIYGTWRSSVLKKLQMEKSLTGIRCFLQRISLMKKTIFMMQWRRNP